MDYQSFFRRHLDSLHAEGRYRIFADLKRRKLITVKGSSISLKNHDALAAMVSS